MANYYGIVGQAYAADGTATVTSTRRFTTAGGTITVTTTGTGKTFTIACPIGTSATVTSGTATITSSPKSCPAGATTTVTISNNPGVGGTCTIAVTYATTGSWTSAYSWATTSGGAPNAGPPTSSDSVYFDANSFGGAGETFTVDGGSTCNTLDFTGATNSPTFLGTSGGYYILTVYGNVTFIAAMTVSGSYDWTLKFNGLSTFTTNGVTVNAIIEIDVGANVTLGGLLNCLEIQAYGGQLTTAGYAINATQIIITPSDADVTFTLSSSIITLSNTYGNAWIMTVSAYQLYITGLYTIVLTGYQGVFAGGNFTYYALQLNTSTTVQGINTFTNLTFNTTAGPMTITFTDGGIQYVSGVCSKTADTNVATLTGSGAGGWGITKTGGGTESLDYLNISYSAALPITLTWYAGTHSTNGTGNTGWIFTAPPAGGGNISAIPLGFIHGG